MTTMLHNTEVYAAEQLWKNLVDRALAHGLSTLVIGGSTVAIPVERKFERIEDVQQYVDRVLAEVAAEYGVSDKVTVRARKGDRWARYEGFTQTIAIPPHRSWERSWAMREIVVLHEIAHHLTRQKEVREHGPQFLAARDELVRRFMGEEAAYMIRVFTHEAR